MAFFLKPLYFFFLLPCQVSKKLPANFQMKMKQFYKFGFYDKSNLQLEKERAVVFSKFRQKNEVLLSFDKQKL